MANQVRVGVGVTGASKASSELDKFRDKFTKLQNQGAKGFAIGAGVAATNFAFGALKGAIQGVGDVIGDATAAFIEDEHSQQKLTTSLRANAIGWDGTTQAIEDRIAAGQRLGFSDDEQRSSLAELVAAYGDVTKSLDVMRTAEDLARFSGVDLATASDVLIKVHAGNYRALKSLGIATDDIHDQTAALAAVQKVAAGQAEDYAQSLEGRLNVSAERSAEAMEHLGQATAELSADFNEAKAGAIENFATGIDFLADSLNASSQSYERQLELTAELIAMNPLMTQSQKDAATASLQLELNNYKLTGTMGATRAAIDDVTVSERKASRATGSFSVDVEKLAAEAKDTETAIAGLTDSIETGLFGKAITAGHEAQLRLNIRDLEKQREETHKGSLKWIELTGEIAENRKELFDLHLEQAAEKGPNAAIAFLKKEIARTGDASGELQKLIEKYERLAQLQGAIQPIMPSFGIGGLKGGPARKHATGGFGAPGELSLVGEEGPELRVEGNHGSTYFPLKGGTSGGGSITVNINVSTPALTPGGAEALARHIAPHLTRWQQQRGLVGGVRAF